MKYCKDLKIVGVEYPSDGYVLLKLTDEGCLPSINAGQFVEIKVEGSPSTFLRRPISIHFVDVENNQMWLLIQLVGEGTRKLAQLHEGDSLNVLFPLGNGFTKGTEGEKVLLVDVNSKTVMYNCSDPDAMRMALWDKVFLRNKDKSTVLEQNDKYATLITVDAISKSKYLEMWGFLSGDYIFLMRTAFASISDAAAITNKFVAFWGLIIIILSVLTIVLATRKMTKPLLNLAALSDRMSELDFEARYEGKDKNEIGLLGQNYNKMSEALEKTISELKSANIELQKDIDRKNAMEEMRSEFISNVSHELKTPLAVIQGYAEGLAEGISEDKESRDYYCGVICDEAQKMNNMVKQLLKLNELEFGKTEFSMERFDIVTLISNRVKSTELLTKQAGIEVLF